MILPLTVTIFFHWFVFLSSHTIATAGVLEGITTPFSVEHVNPLVSKVAISNTASGMLISLSS
jgi:hypothetical protein